MKECWINVYKWFDPHQLKYLTFPGKDCFTSREDAISHIPSFGLKIAYRIHVRMK